MRYESNHVASEYAFALFQCRPEQPILGTFEYKPVSNNTEVRLAGIVKTLIIYVSYDLEFSSASEADYNYRSRCHNGMCLFFCILVP